MINYEFINFVDLTPDQIECVFLMRNKEFVRKWMANSAPITFSEHLDFIASLKGRKDTIYLMAIRNNIYPAGVYTLKNIKNRSAEVGFYTSEYAIDNNLAIEFCYKAIDYVFNSLSIDKIYGYSMAENTIANKINKIFGFSFNHRSNKLDDTIFLYSELTRFEWTNKVSKCSRLISLLNFTSKK
jgi:UDP-4-amino-4,6-dideoxy-N-acetyl-beta-L-altrosamine N-acetyltransferase